MKIVTTAWIDGECVGEATAEQLEQHRLGTLPDNVELEQEGRFDPNDGSVPDCDVRLSWIGRSGRESFVADGDEWTNRAENGRPDSWNDIEECDDADTYWDRCLRILGEGRRDFKVEILMPYDEEANLEKCIATAESIYSDLRGDFPGMSDDDLWNDIVDDGFVSNLVAPAHIPEHQHNDWKKQVLSELEYRLGQTIGQRSDEWHRQQSERRMFDQLLAGRR